MSPARKSNAVSMPHALRVFLLVVLAANVVAVTCELIARFILRLGWPYCTPMLFERSGVDLYSFDADLPFMHSARFFDPHWRVPFAYPAPMAPFYTLLFHIPHRALVFQSFALLLALCAAAGFGWLLHKRTGLGVASCVALAAAGVVSYPLAFEIKQGNLEIIVLAIISAAVVSFLYRHYHLFAVLLGIAAAMKIFPFVYLGLLVSRKRWAAVATFLGTVTTVTLAGLYYTCPDVALAWRGISAGLQFFQKEVALRVPPQASYDHSIFAFLKTVVNGVDAEFFQRHAATLLHGCLALAAVCGVALYFVYLRKLPVINQVLCFCIVSIVFPPVSFDYTLQHLYLPAAILAFYSVRTATNPPRGLVPVWVCLGLLTSIQAEFIYDGRSLGGQIKALTLLVLLVFAIRYPFPSAADKSAPSIPPRDGSPLANLA